MYISTGCVKNHDALGFYPECSGRGVMGEEGGLMECPGRVQGQNPG